MSGDNHLDAVLKGRVAFAFLTAGLLAAFVLLVLVAYWAPIDLAEEHAPTIAYGIFGFAAAMLVALFVTAEGIRVPDRRELVLKVPAILVSLVLCFLVLGWMRQLDSLIEQSGRLEAACKAVRAPQTSDAVGDPITARYAAEREAIEAVKELKHLWAVRRPALYEDAPCD